MRTTLSVLLSIFCMAAVTAALAQVAPGKQLPAPEAKRILPKVEGAASPKAAEWDAAEQMSYSLGHKIGKNLGDLGMKVDREAFLKGIRDVIEEKEEGLTEQEAKRAMNEYYLAVSQYRKKVAELKAEGAEDTEVEAPIADEQISTGCYGMGLQVGRTMRDYGPDLNLDLFASGINRSMDGEEPWLSEIEIDRAMDQYDGIRAERRAEAKRKEAEVNRAKGKAFFAENAKKEGVVTLPSGLQYRIIKDGTGANPTMEDRIKVHYRGTLLDGKEIDTTLDDNKPKTLKMVNVIKGWAEALPLMKEGAKWEIFVPDHLAYGDKGFFPRVPPGALLNFEVELLEVLPPVDAVEIPQE